MPLSSKLLDWLTAHTKHTGRNVIMSVTATGVIMVAMHMGTRPTTMVDIMGDMATVTVTRVTLTHPMDTRPTVTRATATNLNHTK